MVNEKKITKFHNEHPKTFICYRYMKGNIMMGDELKIAYILIYNNKETEYCKLYIVNNKKTKVEVELKNTRLGPLFDYLDKQTSYHAINTPIFTNRLVKDTNSDFKAFIKVY